MSGARMRTPARLWLLVFVGALMVAPQARSIDLVELERRLEQGKLKARQIIETLESLDNTIAELYAESERLKREASRQADELLRIDGYIGELEAQHQQQTQRLARSMRAFYIHGRRSFLELVLNAESLDDMASRTRSLKRIIESRRSLAEGMRVTIAELERQRQEQTDLLAKATETSAAIEQQSEDLVAHRSAQLRVYQQLKDDAGRLEYMAERGRRAEEQLRRYTDSRDLGQASSGFLRRGSFRELKGRLRPPVQDAVLVRGYGFFDIPGEKQPGKSWGLDFQARDGAEVKVVADGLIAEVQWVPSMGRTILVKHADGYISVYANVRTVVVDKGARVKGGQVIAYVGSDDEIDKHRFHFQLRNSAKKVVNPEPWLSGL